MIFVKTAYSFCSKARRYFKCACVTIC